MSDRRVLGEILLEAGRVSPEDVEGALVHQRSHGGRFVEALLALGTTSVDEVEWGLAAQFDLPCVFPDAAGRGPSGHSGSSISTW